MDSTDGHHLVVDAYYEDCLRTAKEREAERDDHSTRVQDREDDERAFMQRVLVDRTATGAALTAEQHGYLSRWHTQGWWTHDGMSLSNGHLTEDGRTALHERSGGSI